MSHTKEMKFGLNFMFIISQIILLVTPCYGMKNNRMQWNQ